MPIRPTRWVIAPAIKFDGHLEPAALRAQLDEVGRRAEASLVVIDEVTGPEPIDAFAVAGALSGTQGSCSIGVAVHLGRGRSAPVAARELTTLDHLAHGRTGLVLIGSSPRLHDAVAVVLALLGPEELATVAGEDEHVASAPNRPAPTSPGGPPVVALNDERLEARLCRLAEPSVELVVIEVDGMVVLEGLGSGGHAR